ncbi:MAG: DJ-1/PfpI family protein [Solobacterium sp.]|nr:DJ-1/PfpI family protein [Solobacterium sp.]
MRTAVIAADGCEEGETLTIIDILRRAQIGCELVGLDKAEATGAHGITIACDRVLGEDVADYDMVILPGGYGGADAMCASAVLRGVLMKMHEAGKKLAAICAAPEAFDRAGLLAGKNFTCYPTVRERIRHGTWREDKVVVDGNLITGKGPAVVWAFAYKLVDELGGDSLTVKKRMVYFNAFDVREDE